MTTIAELAKSIPANPHERITDLRAAVLPGDEGHVVFVIAMVDGSETGAHFSMGIDDEALDAYSGLVKERLRICAVDALLTAKRVHDLFPHDGKQWMYEDGELVEF